MISESVNQWSTIDRGSTSCTSKGAGQKFNIQKGKKKKILTILTLMTKV